MQRKPHYFTFQLIGIFNRVLKNILFNIGMLCIGFCIGAGVSYFKMYQIQVNNPDFECVRKLSEKLDQLEEMDRDYIERKLEMRRLIDEFQIKLRGSGRIEARRNPAKTPQN